MGPSAAARFGLLLALGALLFLPAPSTGVHPGVVPAALSVSIAASPSQGAAPLLVSFSATATGVANPLTLFYNWSFGDGTYYGKVGLTSISHTYGVARASPYVANVTVNDSSAHTNQSIPVLVETAALVVSISATPLSGTVPLTVSFTADVSGGSGTYASLLWNFGNGATGSGSPLLETYDRPGSYRANLTVTDSQGATMTASVWINASAPSGGGPPPGPTSWVSEVETWLPWGIAIAAVVLAGLVIFLNGPEQERRRWATVGRRTERGPKGPDGPERPANMATPGEAAHEEDKASKGPVSPAVVGPAGSASAPSTTPTEPTTGPGSPAAPTASEAETPVPSTRSDALAPGAASVPESPSTPRAETSSPPAPLEETPPNTAVPAETLRLSYRLVVHLASQGALGPHDVAPAAFTQAGMAQALGTRQNSVATLLKRLEVAGVLSSDVRHVQGASRRMKVYRLTPRGEALAREIRGRRGSTGRATDGE